MRSLLLALAAALTFSFAAPAFAGGKAKPVRKPRVECSADADCVLVPDGCCGCEAGGKQRAIPASKQKADQQAREGKCKQTMCASVMSQDPSCSGKAVCKEGMCAVGS